MHKIICVSLIHLAAVRCFPSSSVHTLTCRGTPEWCNVCSYLSLHRWFLSRGACRALIAGRPQWGRFSHAGLSGTFKGMGLWSMQLPCFRAMWDCRALLVWCFCHCVNMQLSELTPYNLDQFMIIHRCNCHMSATECNHTRWAVHLFRKRKVDVSFWNIL